jgi:metallo-beta-lactamase family protein
MRITFLGAAKTTTGSMHLVEVNGKRLLLDCGLVQGRRKEAFEKNRNLPFDAASIDKVLLSHAHIDHSGNLPSLTRNGFKGEIVATGATRDLCEIMLADSAYLQVRDVEYVNKKRTRQGKNPFEPLYTPGDAAATLKLFRGIGYEQPFEVAPGVTAVYHDAGHILGSAMITLSWDDTRLLFTGDMGRSDQLILRDPTVVHDIDCLITESTYANRDHPPKPDVLGRLKAFVEDIVQLRSKLIIPSFSVGRTQNIVYRLRELYDRGRIPDVPVYVDSPLSSKATAVYRKHRECYDEAARQVLLDGDAPFKFNGLKYLTDVEDSKKLNNSPGPAIIISASGMCEGGRILHHLKNNIEDPRNIILIVGYQAEHTLGRRLVERREPIRIFGETYKLEARVHTINALSAHADRGEMMAYFRAMGPEVAHAFCVHGEEEQVAAMADLLADAGAKDVLAPDPGTHVEI